MSVLDVRNAPDGWRYIEAAVPSDVAEVLDLAVAAVESDRERYASIHEDVERTGIDLRAVVVGGILAELVDALRADRVAS